MSRRTTEPTDLVVFAGGRGSNFRALCQAARDGRLHARVRALVSNVADAGACAVAREFGVPVLEVPHRGLDREAHESAVLKALTPISFQWIALAGYMRLFTPAFVGRFADEQTGTTRIVNVHPSLLPAFPGKDGYAQALLHGVKVTGVTVHLVGDGLDDGPIVAQQALEVRDGDDEESLSARGLLLEHELYPAALNRLLVESWSVKHGPDGRGRPRVVFSGEVQK